MATETMKVTITIPGWVIPAARCVMWMATPVLMLADDEQRDAFCDWLGRCVVWWVRVG